MQKLKWAFSLLLAVLLLYLLFKQVKPAELSEAWGNLSLAAIVMSCAALALDYVFRALRWRMMLTALGSPVSTGACLGPLLAGFALNNVLPLRAGDIARAFSFTRVLQLSADKISGTLIIERVLDLFALCVVFLLGLAMAPIVSSQSVLPPIAFTVIAASIALFFVLLYAPAASARLVARLVDTLLPRGARADQIRLFIEQVFASLVTLGRHRTLLPLLAISALVWTLEASVFFLVLSDLQSPTSVAASLFSMALGTLGTLLPSTPGYIGTFDYFSAAGMQAYGTSPSVATMATLAVHLVLWLPITVAGLGYLLYQWRGTFRTQIRQVRKESTHE